MRFRHFSTVKILKGKLEWCVRKWRFSPAKISAPTYSVYAAIKASAGLKPAASYLKTVSNEATKSSSTVVNVLINLLNSWNASVDKFRLISSNIARGIRIVCERLFSDSKSKNRRALSYSCAGPKANIYSLESMTKRNFFLSNSFSGFTQSFYHIFFAHFKNRRRIFGYNFSEFLKMFLGFFRLFHFSSPLNKGLFRVFCG